MENSSAESKDWSRHFVFFILLTLFPPATILTVLIYIILRWVRVDRALCMHISVAVGVVAALAQIVVMVGALVFDKPIF